MKIFLSAAEASSDLHASCLISEIRKIDPNAEIFALAGVKSAKQGARIIYPSEKLLSMGFVEVLNKIPNLIRAFLTIRREIFKTRPQVAVLMDYWGFHRWVGLWLKFHNIPVVYYIPPKMWAWGGGRKKIIARFVKKILYILPFEKDFYKKTNLEATYVGNPLLDELPLGVARNDARKQLGISDDATVLVLLLGSRMNEFKGHLRASLDAIRILQKSHRLITVIPVSESLDFEMCKTAILGECLGDSFYKDCKIIHGSSALAMRAANFGIIKSGTSTLEAALLECPHVIIYSIGMIARVILLLVVRYSGYIGLPNLISAGRVESPFRELVAGDVRGDLIADSILEVWKDPVRIQKQEIAFAHIRKELTPPKGSPSKTAALEVLAVAGRVLDTAHA